MLPTVAGTTRINGSDFHNYQLTTREVIKQWTTDFSWCFSIGGLWTAAGWHILITVSYTHVYAHTHT